MGAVVHYKKSGGVSGVGGDQNPCIVMDVSKGSDKPLSKHKWGILQYLLGSLASMLCQKRKGKKKKSTLVAPTLRNNYKFSISIF